MIYEEIVSLYYHELNGHIDDIPYQASMWSHKIKSSVSIIVLYNDARDYSLLPLP